MDYEGVMVVHKPLIVNRVLFSWGWHWGGVNGILMVSIMVV